MNASPIQDAQGLDAYRDFLRRKMCVSREAGFEIDSRDINPVLKPHQRVSVQWMARGGRRALFASFGLGKTLVQLELVRLVAQHAGGAGLIVLPLGVRGEFIRDAQELLRWSRPPRFIRSIEEADSTGIYLTNYETVREGKLDPKHFAVVDLDECAVLRGLGGTKTFRECMRQLAGDGKFLNERVISDGIPYRFAAAAVPSPNDYIELLAYAAFLGVLEVGEAKTRFFKRDSEKADNLTLLPNRAEEFWRWVASWALFMTKPSDLNPSFSDADYVLPPLNTHWHELPSDYSSAGEERDGQLRLLPDATFGVQEASREKRSSLSARVAKLQEIALAAKQAGAGQIVVWCELNSEQEAVEKALTQVGITVTSLDGSQSIDDREALMQQWRDRKTEAFISKASMYGAGVNLQQSQTMIFAGIGFKFLDTIQAEHRIHRFGQTDPCDVHYIYTEAERPVRERHVRKGKQHKEMVAKVTALIQEHGLSQQALFSALTQAIGVERVEVSGENWTMVNEDSVIETRRMAESSVDLMVYSPPFSQQYQYVNNFADFGHADTNAHFFEQMDFLTPELLRILKPGRIMAVHVKNRIVPGGMTGLGFQTVYDFRGEYVRHCQRHGFGFLGEVTVVTDVVRENNQTYRLAYTEQCKDSTKMGYGMSEYVLFFRKPPTDNSNGYADTAVRKSKADYSLARWQVQAHGLWRDGGNRLMNPEELRKLTHKEMFRLFRRFSLESVYDFEQHVKIGETISAHGRLPVTFMLLQPQSQHPAVWTDIARMITLNSSQKRKGAKLHLCPLQFGIVDRIIEQHSMPGEVVFDPFAGIGTVPYRAVLKGRYGRGCELGEDHFLDACGYCKAAERQMAIPDLFAALEAEGDDYNDVPEELIESSTVGAA